LSRPSREIISGASRKLKTKPITSPVVWARVLRKSIG
jgi:hypothetical protein